MSDTNPLLPSVRRAWRRISPLFERRGIPIMIGGYGPFRLHPRLVVGTYDFEGWGVGHNGGFRQWVEACRGKTRVLDIGAHIGITALPASAVLAAGGHLFAFEPAVANRRYLEAHLAYNAITNVTVVASLVGATPARAIPFFEGTDVDGTSSIVKKTIAYKRNFIATTRDQVTLDDFCRAHDCLPEVVKIDVEGGEVGVLDGARAILATARPIIFLSVHPKHLADLGSSVAALSDRIRTLGYTVFDVFGSPVEHLEKAEYILRPTAYASVQ